MGQILAPPLLSCVTLGMLLYISVPWFLHPYSGVIIVQLSARKVLRMIPGLRELYTRVRC